MTEFLEFLNSNSGALSVIFAAVVMGATVVYAKLTATLVRETRQLRQAQTEPRIEVIYRTSEHWINFLNITIKNIGAGPAYDIKFTVRRISENSGAEELVEALMRLSSFSGGLAYLGPGQEYSSFWTSLVEGDPTKVESRLGVTCRYRNVMGEIQTHDCPLDLTELKGSSQIGEPPLQSIAKNIETIRKNLEYLATGFKRLKVDTYDELNRQAERELLEKRHKNAGQ